MKKYTYDGYAERLKPNINLIRVIFLVIVIAVSFAGILTGYPQLICIVVLFPMVNIIFNEKLIPCKITVQIENEKIYILYHNIKRNDITQNEIYEFGKGEIKKIYWLKRDKKIGICGYPKIKYCEDSKIVKILNCRTDKRRKRIYVQYPYNIMYVNIDKDKILERQTDK